MKKIWLVFLAFILVAASVFYILTERDGDSADRAEQPTPTRPMPGSDRDEHNCIGSAGYSWCEVKNKCLRIWEEECK